MTQKNIKKRTLVPTTNSFSDLTGCLTILEEILRNPYFPSKN